MPRRIIGIGEYVVTRDPLVTIVTHALGSCIAVCLWDAKASVAGMLHFLLPDAKLNPERARIQPGAFADTGIPLLFQTAYECGAQKGRCRVSLIGGATVTSGSIDIGRRTVTYNDQPLMLTPTEFRLLSTLASEPDHVFSREELATRVWGYESIGESRVVDVHIRRLRQKLDEGHVTDPMIITLRGFGYKISRTGV